MLDERDLQAIASLMDAKLAQQKAEILGEMDTKLAVQKKDILSEATHNMKVLIDSEVKPQFNLLAEQIGIIEEKVDGLTPTDSVYADIYAMKAAIRTINKEIKALKQAQ